jgi:hypothetical protein
MQSSPILQTWFNPYWNSWQATSLGRAEHACRCPPTMTANTSLLHYLNHPTRRIAEIVSSSGHNPCATGPAAQPSRVICLHAYLRPNPDATTGATGQPKCRPFCPTDPRHPSSFQAHLRLCPTLSHKRGFATSPLTRCTTPASCTRS